MPPPRAFSQLSEHGDVLGMILDPGLERAHVERAVRGDRRCLDKLIGSLVRDDAQREVWHGGRRGCLADPVTLHLHDVVLHPGVEVGLAGGRPDDLIDRHGRSDPGLNPDASGDFKRQRHEPLVRARRRLFRGAARTGVVHVRAGEQLPGAQIGVQAAGRPDRQHSLRLEVLQHGGRGVAGAATEARLADDEAIGFVDGKACDVSGRPDGAAAEAGPDFSLLSREDEDH